MPLTEGTRLGSYEITGQIGAGGMGEVYLATDTKLGRDVAIKTLPAALATDKGRLARFEREAKLLAALNHPHIASIYSLDEDEGTLYLAMELVEGETLEDRLKPGALPVEDALRLGLQIAEALEAAHDKGVVHRDLKPANVMVTADGIIKVLDFGLAKPFSEDPDRSNVAQSPALSVAMTQQGLVLGTVGYMSPEQASGKPTDQRADIWGFGVVLYEMLAGLPPFTGESVTHILADVLKTEPDWNRLPDSLHPRLRLMLERCLTKKPRDRYHSMADARIDIEQVLSDPENALPHFGSSPSAANQKRPFWRRAVVPIGALGIGAAVAAIASWYLMLPEDFPVSRFIYVDPEARGLRNTNLPAVAISPDGRSFVYNASSALYLRRMGELEARLIPGTELAQMSPTFSPDGRELVYYEFSDRQLKRISINGGASTVLAEFPAIPWGMSWGADGAILIGQPDGVLRVPQNGGTPELIIESGEGEAIYGPRLLPDMDTVLFTSGPLSNWDAGRIYAESLSTGDRTLILEGGYAARYLASGHLVYAVGSALFAAPFDADRLAVTGGAMSVTEGVMRTGPDSAAQYDVSDDGTLLYVRGGFSDQALVSVDHRGLETSIGLAPRSYLWTRISPDGSKAALQVNDGGNTDIFVSELDRGTLTRITRDSASDQTPLWAPDGDNIAFWSDRNGGNSMYSTSADGRGRVEHVIDFGEAENVRLYEWTSDGSAILFEYSTPETGFDIGVIEMDDEPTWRPLLAEELTQGSPAISPNGNWFAYLSDESGEFEIYVERFPDGGQRRQITTESGVYPVWSPNGQALFYRNWSGNGAMMRVDFDADDPELTPQGSELLFVGQRYPQANLGRDWDIAPGGEHFLMIKSGQSDTAAQAIQGYQFIVVENWFTELKQLVSSD